MKYIYAFLIYIAITVIFSYVMFRLITSGQPEWKRLDIAWKDCKYVLGCEIRKLLKYKINK